MGPLSCVVLGKEEGRSDTERKIAAPDAAGLGFTSSLDDESYDVSS